MATKPKPSGLGPEHGAQFADKSVAQAYPHRLPYPTRLFPFLGSLQPQGPGRILELGCGGGELTEGLMSEARNLDAVDPSQAMLTAARLRLGESPSGIAWHEVSAESFEYLGPYSLVVAAASLHWMDWDVVLPNIASSISPGGYLAIVSRTRRLPDRLTAGLRTLIPRYSTNQDFEPYDLVEELAERGFFEEVGRKEFEGEVIQRSVSDFVESIHSQNGFSRDRMSEESAAEFDRLVGELVEPHAENGILDIPSGASVVWGRARHP